MKDLKISQELAMKIFKGALYDAFNAADNAFYSLLEKGVKDKLYAGETCCKNSIQYNEFTADEKKKADKCADRVFSRMMNNQQYVELLEIFRQDCASWSALYGMADVLGIWSVEKEAEYQML